MNNYFDSIKNILFGYSSLGVQTLKNDAILIAKTPHKGPDAWFHYLFPPLIQDDINTIEQAMHKSIPLAYQIFLLNYSNGISLFGNTFNLYGVRKSNGRMTMEDSAQPYSIKTPNTAEAPKNLPEHCVIIGGYSSDGSKVYIDGATQKVYCCARRDATPLFEWSSFEEMLLAETIRLQPLFDTEGRRIDKSVPTTPFLR